MIKQFSTKISALNSSLHQSTAFDNSSSSFIKSIEDKLGQKIEYTTLDDYDCALKLIFVSSGGSEGLFLSNFKLLKSPYLILTQGTNNSLAASLEILTYLNNNNLDGEIIHGSIDYIATRISELLNKTTTNKWDGVCK